MKYYEWIDGGLTRTTTSSTDLAAPWVEITQQDFIDNYTTLIGASTDVPSWMFSE